jgi:DNA-binding NarL/FixJ family response regulator
MVNKSILLVEDDTLLRMGLKSMIDMRGNYVIEWDVASGEEAVRCFRQKATDIVLLDIRLPDIPGTHVLRRIKEMDPKALVIVLSACDDNELIFETLEYGASGYVLKGANPDELFLAMEYALLGDLFISPQLAKYIVGDYLFVNRKRKKYPSMKNLTTREKEIIHLVTDGMKSSEIADFLSISVKTVNKHRSNIISKLGIRSCSELVHSNFYYVEDKMNYK